MKKTIVFFILFSNFIYSQNSSIGLNIGCDKNYFIDFHNEVNDVNFKNGNSYDIGFFYKSKVKNNLYYSVGLDYSDISHLADIILRDEIILGYKYNYKLLSLPIELQKEFAQYFYINAGILPHFNLNDSRHNYFNFEGIGANVGLGIKFKLNNFNVYFGPQIRMYSIINFKESFYKYILLNSGFQLNTGYSF
jgi:hypothetical protein